jgi:hypothetical protein
MERRSAHLSSGLRNPFRQAPPCQTGFLFFQGILPSMKNLGCKIAFIALLAGAVGISAQFAPPSAPPGQVKVTIDPRSSEEAEAWLLSKGFPDFCPNISVVRNESEAEYAILTTWSDPSRRILLHYYITAYDKQGKVVFSTDKHEAKNATKALCQFINGQK